MSVCAAVPGRPVVRVKETSANTIILEVEPPRNNGGKEVTIYRVEFYRNVFDYAVAGDVGMFAAMIITSAQN